MSDISSINQNRRQFDRDKKELQEDYSDELNSLREHYNDNIKKEREAGEAAISHIKKEVTEKAKQAETQAEEQNRVTDIQYNRKLENLRSKQTAEENYLQQLKTRHAEWTQAQRDDLKRQEDKIVNNSAAQINSLQERNAEKIKRANDKVREIEKELNTDHSQKMQELRRSYVDKRKAVEESHHNQFEQQRQVHAKLTADEDKNFKSAYQRYQEGHFKEMENQRTAYTTEREKLKQGSERQVAYERKLAEQKVQQAEKEGHTQIKSTQTRYEKAGNELRSTQQKNLEQLNKKNDQETRRTTERHKREMELEKSEFEKQNEQLNQRHEVAREKKIKSAQADLEALQKGNEERMMGQVEAFEKRFAANEQEARRTFSDQAVNLGRELVNQKQKFLKFSDKYASKAGDPFYQIRDNKTSFHETAGAYVFKAHVPEYEKDNVSVKVKQDRLILSGTRNFEDQIDQDGHIVKSSNVQSFQEFFDIPKKIKEGEIIKEYNNGVLTVIIPKV